MDDVSRIKSILSEIEYGYIGYDNLHGDDDHGLKIIESALKDFMPEPPVKKDPDILHGIEDYSMDYYTCPKCQDVLIEQVFRNGEFFIEHGLRQPCCNRCKKRIIWEGVKKYE